MLRNSIWFVIFLSSKNHFKSKLFNKTCSRLKQALKPYLNGENYREYKDSNGGNWDFGLWFLSLRIPIRNTIPDAQGCTCIFYLNHVLKTL